MTGRPLEAELRAGISALGLVCSAAQVAALLDYQELLAKWNRVYNLTSVRDPQEMLRLHLLDSLAAVGPLQRWLAGSDPAQQAPHRAGGETSQVPKQLLDVGSGGGLPGVVFAICCPEVQIDCVDTVAKKAAFVQQAAVALGLVNLRGLHARVESLSERYDLVSSRAFASLADFTAWSRQAVAERGVWMAMKAKHPAEEIAALASDVEVFHVEPLTVPGLDVERCIIWMRPHDTAR